MDSNLLLLVVCLLIARLLFFLYKSIRILYAFRNVPGPRPRLPIIGNVLMFFRRDVPTSQIIYTVLKDVYQKHKDDGMAVVYFGSTITCYLFKPEHLSYFLNDPSMVDKSTEYGIFKPWLGEGLITSNGQIWKQKRKLLNPTFHSKILEDYIPVMNDLSFKFVKELSQTNHDFYIDIRSIMSEFTLNVIAETAMGVTLQRGSKEVDEYRECLHTLPTALVSRIYNPLYWSDKIFYNLKIGKDVLKNINTLHKFTMNVIKRRKETFTCKETNNNNKRMAFLDLLLTLQTEDPSISDESIREHVDAFMFAGHDTSAVCLTWTLFLLGKHSEAQRKVKEELEIIFGDEKQRNVTLDDINRMVYTENCIKESLRLYPPGPAFGRIARNDFEVDGHKFPKGTNLIFLLREIQRDEKVFWNPNSFFPERFEVTNSSTLHSAFMPFATGPRNCIGQRFAMIEMKVMLAHIFRNFKISSFGEEEDFEFSVDSTLQSLTPVLVHFESDFN